MNDQYKKYLTCFIAGLLTMGALWIAVWQHQANKPEPDTTVYEKLIGGLKDQVSDLLTARTEHQHQDSIKLIADSLKIDSIIRSQKTEKKEYVKTIQNIARIPYDSNYRIFAKELDSFYSRFNPSQHR